MYISILQKSGFPTLKNRLYNSKKAIEFSLQLLPKFLYQWFQQIKGLFLIIVKAGSIP